MVEEGESRRDLAALVVPLAGGLVQTGDRYEPYRLADADGAVVEAVIAYFRDLLAAGRADSTVRSYGTCCTGSSSSSCGPPGGRSPISLPLSLIIW